MIEVVCSLKIFTFHFFGCAYHYWPPHGNCKDLTLWSCEWLDLLPVFFYHLVLCCSECGILFIFRSILFVAYFLKLVSVSVFLIFFAAISSCAVLSHTICVLCVSLLASLWLLWGRVFNGTCMCTYILLLTSYLLFSWLCTSSLLLLLWWVILNEKKVLYSQSCLFLCLFSPTFCLFWLALLLFILS